MTGYAYSRIYSQLVKDGDDLVGLIAYGLYKREKLEFIAKIRAERADAPSNGDVQAFHTAATTEGRLGNYRDQAERLLARFSEEMLEVQAGTLQAEYEQELISELKSAQPFWQGVWQNLAANVLALAISALVLVILWASKIGFLQVIELIFGVHITDA